MEETADRIPWAQQTINKRFYLGPGIHPSIVSSIVFSFVLTFHLWAQLIKIERKYAPRGEKVLEDEGIIW